MRTEVEEIIKDRDNYHHENVVKEEKMRGLNKKIKEQNLLIADLKEELEETKRKLEIFEKESKKSRKKEAKK